MDWPAIQCPYCRASTLELREPQYVEDVQSVLDRGDDDWEPSRIHGFFHAELYCPRSQCGRAHAIGGVWRAFGDDESLSIDFDEGLLVRSCEVRFAVPPLPIASLPIGIPDHILDLLLVASSVMFCDPSSAANRIRTAIEVMLDQEGIPKIKRQSLHQRIEAYRPKNSAAVDHLLAMKYIGNLGSHERRPIPIALVLEGVELFVHALEIVYGSHDRELAVRAARIIEIGDKLTPQDRF